MTQKEKDQITKLRKKGLGYAKIAVTVGISKNTVKSFCQRNSLGAAGSFGDDCTADASDSDVMEKGVCEQCGVSIIHKPHRKKKRFCSDKCRMKWWNTHPASVKRDAYYRFNCLNCGAEFESYGNKSRKYCSRACFGSSRRVVNE